MVALEKKSGDKVLRGHYLWSLYQILILRSIQELLRCEPHPLGTMNVCTKLYASKSRGLTDIICHPEGNAGKVNKNGDCCSLYTISSENLLLGKHFQKYTQDKYLPDASDPPLASGSFCWKKTSSPLSCLLPDKNGYCVRLPRSWVEVYKKQTTFPWPAPVFTQAAGWVLGTEIRCSLRCFSGLLSTLGWDLES